MDRKLLAALHTFARLTPKELAKAHPELHARLVAKVEQLKRTPAGQPELEPLLGDIPLAANPLVRPELERARVHVLGDMAGLSEQKVEAVAAASPTLSTLNDATLSALVAGETLTEPEARRLGLAASLYFLFDEDAAVLDAATKRVNSVRDLAGLDAKEWADVLTRAQVRPPPGLDVRSFAGALADRIALLHPTDTFLARLHPTDGATLARALEGMPAADRERFANRYPGLGVDAILAEPGLSSSERASRVLARLDVIARVQELNPGRELLALDYSAGGDAGTLRLDGLGAEDRRAVLSALKSYQRTFVLTKDVTDAHALLEAGYASAFRIVKDDFTTFARRTGLRFDKARRVYDDAHGAVASITAVAGSFIDILRGGFNLVHVHNLDRPSIEDYLRKLDGFEQLFGSQAFCRCEHCQSILSPAAYFVDLMLFIEEHLLDVVFAQRPDHPLHLRSRRPDLWTLELTCKNTNERIPTLDIVNEILESYIARFRGYNGALTDRTAVERVVYEQALAVVTSSFREPFVLPLLRLDTYLVHFDRTRAEVARALEAPAAVAAAARLRVPKAEYDLITQASNDLAFLRRVYGLDFQPAGNVIAPFRAQELLSPTGLTRAQLGELVATRFVRAVAPNVEIRSEKTDADSVQNDIERIYHLNVAALDRMHRLTRIQGRLPWTLTELDLVLTQLGDAGLPDPSAQRVVAVLDAQETLKLGADEVCALFSDLPRLPAAPGATPLFDRAFNLPFYVAVDGVFPKDQTKFVHPSFRPVGANPAVEHTLHRLLGGLRVSDEDLVRLITHLAPALGVNLASNDPDDKGFNLTVANLSLLYRHARLAERLNVSVPELFQLVEHTVAIAGGRVENLAHLGALLELAAWWRGSGYTLDDLGLVTGKTVRDPSAYPDAAAVAQQLIDGVKRDEALQFADTVFAFVAGVTEEQSRAVVAANAPRIEPTPDGTAYRLAAAFDPAAALVIPAGVQLAQADARAALLTHHASELIPTRLAARLALPAGKTRALIAMTGTDPGSAAFTTALQGGAAGPLIDLVAALRPLAALFKNAVYDAAALDFVRTHAALFGVAAFANVAITAVRKISVYTTFTDRSKQANFTTAQPIDPADVRSVLDAFDPAQRFANADQQALARVVGGEPGLVATVTANVTLPATAPEALAKLGRCVTLARYLGINGDLLTLIVSDQYADLTRAADAVLSAFRAKYADEAEWRENLEPFDDKIREAKRDALVDFVLHTVRGPFEKPNDLYHYFLIDVQFEGCARTSRVVAAISAAQLYVERCLMNLEQDRREPDDPERVAVAPALVPTDEWAWRKNYRVWEANRKVFLYPENYIEPELRDDKTPLFEELESTLLQQEIDDQNVLDAYAAYVKGYEELAGLNIAGVFHEVHPDRAEGRDILHVFGAHHGDPPTYYYRTVENLISSQTEKERGVIWSPWRQINVQIPARRVGLVVHRGRLHGFWQEIATRPYNRVHDGNSDFVGYVHKLVLKFTTLRLDGTWTPPQQLAFPTHLYPFLQGPVVFDNLDGNNRPEHGAGVHLQPRDDYTLRGKNWEEVYLDPTDEAFNEAGAAQGGFTAVYAQGDPGSGIGGYNLASAADRAFAFDHDHSGKLDHLALYRPGTGTIWILRNDAGTFSPVYAQGDPGSGIGGYDLRSGADRAFAFDHDHSGKLDHLVLYRPGTGTIWILRNDAGSFSPVYAQGDPGNGIGGYDLRSGEDRAFAFDYDHSGKLDHLVLYRPGTGTIWILKNEGGKFSPVYAQGAPGNGIGGYDLKSARDRVFAFDYDGSGKQDHLALYRPGTGTIWILANRGGNFEPVYAEGDPGNGIGGYNLASAADRVFAYDYNGTGKLDHLALYRPGTGTIWILARSGSGFHRVYAEGDPGNGIGGYNLASAADRVLAFDYNGNGKPDHLALYRPGTGTMWILQRPAPVSAAGMLGLATRNFMVHGAVDFYRRKLVFPFVGRWTAPAGTPELCVRVDGNQRRLYYGFPTFPFSHKNAFANMILDPASVKDLADESGGAYDVTPGLYTQPIARLRDDDELMAVSGSIEDAILQAGPEILLIQGSVREGTQFLVRRLGTTLAERIGEKLFLDGVDGLLSTDHQYGLNEAVWGISPIGGSLEDGTNRGRLDYSGPYGVYYREIFFHIPFLLANHLNSQQRYEAAQRWYHYIFNPTATERIPQGLGAEARRQAERDRVWRYRELRGLDLPRLRQILTDASQIDVYKRNPFNPHAIARLRLSAYQKAIVMKYIDNLLDWGDALFSQFTMESVNEASLLYVMALDILGDRPDELGSCGEGNIRPKSYEKIKPHIEDGSEFLLEVETWISGKGAWVDRRKRTAPYRYVADRSAIRYELRRQPAVATPRPRPGGDAEAPPAGTGGGLFRGLDWKGTTIGTWKSVRTGETTNRADVRHLDGHVATLAYDDGRLGRFGWGILRQVSPVFCVPSNSELRAYWDRVEDRLYKIRHCEDITGVKRELPLFAPEIDPRLLVRLRAAGLSLEDVLNATTGDLPPYRFQWLIERARGYAATVQAFGAALLSALEKKDGEELSRLRAVQTQNLLKMTTQIRRQDIAAARETVVSLERQLDAADYRRRYYQNLIDGGRTAAEITQSVARHSATVTQGISGGIQLLAAIGYLIPQLGSPFAMKYGGVELGNSASAFSAFVRGLTALAEGIAASAGLEAGFERREQGWQHQHDLADRDHKQIEKSLAAARIRVEIAEKSLEIHEKTIEQAEEVFEFFAEKFTSFGLYTYLSSALLRIYREAYNGAYAVARLCEQAYRFERGDDASALLQPSYWDATRAGLLAGERLLVDLQTMERRFIETNYRSLEVDQSFSLTQIDPAALATLREKGECEFQVPELFFDLFYPGQYRRRIRAVRLTIPCITGPYTNVGATLTLLESWIRGDANGQLDPVPRRRSVSIATSTAQNDAGVFELNFRDERYMPFEGAGAVSRWNLTLPRSFRQFDYQTINDVIVTIAYTAEQDSVLRGTVESQNAQLEGAILHHLANDPLPRVFSLRQDFSAAFHRLLHSAAGTPVRIEILDKFFPMFLKGRGIRVSKAYLALRPTEGQSVGAASISLDGVAQTGFASLAKLGDLPARDLGPLLQNNLRGVHTLVVQDAGDLNVAQPSPGDVSALDETKLQDVILYVEYNVVTP